jgi:hypothetical protein
MARGVKHTYLHAEAVRLRVEERKSLKEIQAQLGVSTGSLSPWLKSYPLSQDEFDRKRLGKNQNRLGLSFSNTLKTRSEPSKFWSVAQNLLPHQVAHLGEAAIQFRLILNGFRSFRSSFDGDRVDFLVLAGSKSLRIQVKTILASPTKGLPVIHLTHTVGHSRKIRYTSDDTSGLSVL